MNEESTNTLANDDHQCPVEVAMRPFQATNGLGHHGEQAEVKEVIVPEEPDRQSGSEPRVVRAPREPTQKQIEAHASTHIPHAEWCEFCMAGRGRHNLHRGEFLGHH